MGRKARISNEADDHETRRLVFGAVSCRSGAPFSPPPVTAGVRERGRGRLSSFFDCISGSRERALVHVRGCCCSRLGTNFRTASELLGKLGSCGGGGHLCLLSVYSGRAGRSALRETQTGKARELTVVFPCIQACVFLVSEDVVSG